MDSRWFNDSQWDVSLIVEKIYGPNAVGLLHFPGFLKDEKRMELLDEIDQHTDLFVGEPHQVGQVYEDMETIYFGDKEKHAWPPENGFAVLREFKSAYDGLFRELSNHGNFFPGELNSVGIHRYDKEAVGITPHLDPTRYVNIVSIFTLKGAAPFGVCQNRAGNEKTEIQTHPGDLALLRAPRNKDEISRRPFHYVGKVDEERITVLFRQVGKL